MITVSDARKRLKSIRESADYDDEAAHSEEDKLREQVLEAIVEGSPDPVALAKVALKTREIDFARWCA